MLIPLQLIMMQLTAATVTVENTGVQLLGGAVHGNEWLVAWNNLYIFKNMKASNMKASILSVKWPALMDGQSQK